MSQSKILPEIDCTHFCNSRQHGSILTSAITKRAVSDAALASFIRCTCYNYLNILDDVGRSILHMVASRGRKSLLEWLVRKYSSNQAGVNFADYKDPESGYTAFHRSVFYGQIQNAVALMKYGVNISIVDNEDMTGIDLALMDRPLRVEMSKNMPCEVYTWGVNSNYTLGTSSQHHRSVPELLTLFTKQKLHIKQVCLSKFHSAFVSTTGSVWTCGHGEGGRLGVATSDTHVLPSKIPLSDSCAQAAVGRDHTLILLQSGTILSCGLNDHHQLGQVPPPNFSLSPRPAKIRLSSARGIYAARYHSVAFNANVLYTWGLHGGQLGHQKDKEKTVTIPKKVLSIGAGQNDCTIECVAVSDGATVATTSKGDVYLMHQYQCKKIAYRLHNIKSVKVIGGEVIGGDNLTAQQKQIMVLLLNSVGNIYLWQDTTNQFTRCIFNTTRPLFVMEAILARDIVVLTTKLGEAFHGQIMPKKIMFSKNTRNTNTDDMIIAKDKSKHDGSKSFNQFINKDECIMVKLKRLPNVHRAVDICCDSKGNNFAVLQVTPNSSLVDLPQVNSSQMIEDMSTLLEDSSEEDLLHDILLKVKNTYFPVHRYIISHESEYLAALCSNNPRVDLNNSPVEIENVHPIIFKQILTFIYTGTCSLLSLGRCPIKIKVYPETNEIEVYENADIITDSLELDIKKKKESKQKADKKNKEKTDSINDPIRLLQSAAKRFHVTSLYKLLDKFGWEKGNVILRNDIHKVDLQKRKFERNRSMDLWDATIKCSDGISIKAHKCMLAARLEYFNGMFAHSWAESSLDSIVTLPVTHKMMIPIINYLYSDDCPELDECEDFEFLGNMLVICDQFFIERMKEMCEVALSNMLTLKNITDIVQVADTYNCFQLKRCCMEYIMLNLSNLLESKSLEGLSDSILKDLSEYYINFNPNMSKRIITPFSESTSDEIINSLAENFPTDMENLDEDEILDDMQKCSLTNTSKKKPRPRKSSHSETEKAKRRNESSNSISSLDLSNEKSADVQLCLTEISNENSIKGWTKVLSNNQKQQKIIQARLKAVTAVKEDSRLLESQTETFTKLSKNESFSSDKFTSPIQSPTQKSLFDTHYKASSPTEYEDYSPEISRSPQTTLNITVVNTKLSQKQRKRLAMEHKDNLALGEVLKELNNKNPGTTQTTQVDVTPQKNPWQKISTLPLETPSNSKVKFTEILEDQKKQKENLSKMMTKSLALTQLEDKAIEELTRFYNTSYGEEERISVKRVQCVQIAPPQWINKSSKNSPSCV